MKTTRLVCALAAASLGFGSLAYAQGPRGHDRGPGHGPQVQPPRNAYVRPAPPPRPAPPHVRRAPQVDHYYYGARGPEWRRGGRVPPQYRSNHYVVNDWRAHRLAPPPRGHQWVQVGSDYVLMAIATGVIVNLILSQ